MSDEKFVSTKEFDEFVKNHFNHMKDDVTAIKKDVDSLKNSISFVKGQLWAVGGVGGFLLLITFVLAVLTFFLKPGG